MSRSDMPHYTDTSSKLPSEDYDPWPISAGELASLVDLGLSNNKIARYFGVELGRVSALRTYYGLVDSETGPNGVRNLIPEDKRCTNPAVASVGQC